MNSITEIFALPMGGAMEGFSFQSVPVLITPEMAIKMRQDWHYPRQRDIAKDTVALLAKAMAAETFIVGLQVFVCETPDGARYIVNGNHTLEAIIASGRPYALTVTIAKVPSMKRVNAIYEDFDSQRIRTLAHAIRASEDVDDTPLTRKAASAVNLIEKDFKATGRALNSRSEQVGALAEYSREIELLAEALRGLSVKSKIYVLRAPILAVALITIKHQPQSALKFWRAMADIAAPGHPARALYNYCANISAAGGSIASSLQVKAAAQAWNSYYENESRHNCNPSNWQDFFILGTPYMARAK